MSQFQEFLSSLKKFGLEFVAQKYYSSYPGIVTDNDDPEQRGRVKVELPTILGPGMEHPAFAEPHYNKIAGLDAGEFFPPYVGDVVDVFFENGELNHPRYCGGYWEEDELPDDFTESYPDVRGWVFKNGHKLLFDETEDGEKITVMHANGSMMLFDSDGSIHIVDENGGESLILEDKKVTLNSSGDLEVNIKGDVKCTVDGKMDAEITGNLSVKTSGDASVNASGKVNVQSGGDTTIQAGGNVNVTASGKVVVKGTEIDLNQPIGMVLTNITDPVVDLITGVPTIGVPLVKAG